MFACEVALLAPDLPGNSNRALALQKADHVCHRLLGRNRNTPMDMIRHHMSLKDLALFLARQGMEDRAQLPPDLPIQLAAAALGNKHEVVLAVPFRMRQALISVFQRSSFGSLIKPPEEDRTIPASVKPLRVALVEPVAYPSVQLLLSATAQYDDRQFRVLMSVRTLGREGDWNPYLFTLPLTLRYEP